MADTFTTAVEDAGLTDPRQLALDALENFDGHFVKGGLEEWANATERDPAWVIADAWIREAIRLTFEDELPKDRDDEDNWQRTYRSTNQYVLFNVLLHGLAGEYSEIVNQYDWFLNLTDADAPQTPEAIIVQALDNAMAAFGDTLPIGVPRGEIVYRHDFLGPVHSTPFGSRSTYAHIVEFGRRRVRCGSKVCSRWGNPATS